MSSIPSGVYAQLLVPPILWFFLIGGIFSVAVGIGLVISGPSMLRFFETMNRWVSLRKSTRQMSVNRDIWPLIQRFRIPFALVLILAAGFSAYNLINRSDTLAIAAIAGAWLHLSTSFVAWIAGSVRWFLIGGSVAGVVVGIMLIFFPDSLKLIEKGAAHNYSTRELGKEAEVMHFTLDKWVTNHPRSTGWVVVVIGLVEVIDVASLLIRVPALR